MVVWSVEQREKRERWEAVGANMHIAVFQGIIRLGSKWREVLSLFDARGEALR